MKLAIVSDIHGNLIAFDMVIAAIQEESPELIAALLGQGRVQWLCRLPSEWRHEELLLVHASPDDLWNCPTADASDEELRETYGGHEASTVVYCHIHVPFVRRVDGLLSESSR